MGFLRSGGFSIGMYDCNNVNISHYIVNIEDFGHKKSARPLGLALSISREK